MMSATGRIPVRPMLATAGPVPAGSQWCYEFKWDGVRAVVAVGDQAVAWSRNEIDITGGYPELAALPAQVAGRQVILDGELVALDEDGRPSFSLLQDRMHVRSPGQALVAQVPVLYYIFDLLQLDGAPTLELPYVRRRELLDSLGLPTLAAPRSPAYREDSSHPGNPGHPGSAGDAAAGVVGFVPRSFTDGPGTVAAAKAFALEGVVAKLADAVYRPGDRSKSWVKHAFTHAIEVIIVGYRPGRGRRAGTIGSLLVAIAGPDGVLQFAGGIGTGFRDADLRHLQEALAPLRRATPVVDGVPREQSRDATWLEPAVVGEVVYRMRTPDGLLRHAAWRGIRADKTPPQVLAARPVQPLPAVEEVTGSLQTADGAWRVDIVRRDGVSWYRLVRGDAVVDRLELPNVQQLLQAAGVNIADLTERRAA